ncbi:choice-of-anchor C domain-containing protein [Streptosporangium becharense]|uniref:Choice-of-anchor C domain-containing protein n=1 Tax=Streptosporangium becharense TaxID=1816182 RepID=A0A7W9IEM6_9ACTN|nr:DUF642 domain-containing protein [Streptosporangium becharense]MBB2909939.1 choice-of-anchor C domain-containing protein [Streptosporangium becharense]MBB5819106.1 choice-of-anchor C domain-containing protein [Streptosporangium becharense]
MTVMLAHAAGLSRLAVALPAACALALTVGAAAPVPSEGRTSANAPLVSNGSFESPWSPGSTQINAGNTIGAWQVTGGSVDLVGVNSFWPAYRGRQSVDLSGTSGGTIQQVIPTLPGRCYNVVFALAGNTYGGPTIKRGYARISQGPLIVHKNFAFDITGRSPQNMGYKKEGFAFCSQSDRAILRLVSATSGAYGPVVDDVVVTPRFHPYDITAGTIKLGPETADLDNHVAVPDSDD